MNETISEIKYILNKGFLAKSDILNLMILLRTLISENNSKTEFPFIDFYSTWAISPELINNSVGWKLLEKVSSVLVRFTDLPKNHIYEKGSYINDLHFAMHQAIGLPSLRSELITLFKKFSLPKGRLPIDRVWKDFALLLISCLVDRPITFPKDLQSNEQAMLSFKSICESAKNDSKKEIVEFVFFHRDQKLNYATPDFKEDPNFDLYFRLKSSAEVLIIIPVQIF